MLETQGCTSSYIFMFVAESIELVRASATAAWPSLRCTDRRQACIWGI
jgi:hypothetical protein